ncbi:MAG: nuclear transport factor 2 family protein [Pseudomonadota bacterium]
MTPAAHPNISVLMQLDLQNLDACTNIFAGDFIWHYFNPRLPDVHGDYCGVDGLKQFFAIMNNQSSGSFRVNKIDGWTVGDELVVTQVCNQMNFEGQDMEFDAIVVWRIVNSEIAEAWDIPAINTIRKS